jgi:hypothetical protein
MSNPSFESLVEQYRSLRAQLQSGALSEQQFIEEVQKLNTRDSAGEIWAIDAYSGRFITYTEKGWEFREPPTNPLELESAPDTLIKNPGCRQALGILALGLPIASAFLWFAYSSLAPGSEGWDCITPLIIGGLPFVLMFFQRPLDAFLRPFQGIRKLAPRLVLRGAALALPFVLGIICSQTAGTEYRGLRLTLVFSMLGAYVLLRDPEVQ